MIRLIGSALLCVADRFRGYTGLAPKQLKRLLEAYAMTLALGLTVDFGAVLHDVVYVVVVAAQTLTGEPTPLNAGLSGADYSGLWVWLSLWAGICLGSYGNAIGPALTGEKPARAKTLSNPGPEWWQHGELLDDAWTSLVMVGVIWGLPATAVGIYLHQWSLLGFIPALSAAFVISCLIARFAFRGSWAAQQWAFGCLAGAMLFIL